MSLLCVFRTPAITTLGPWFKVLKSRLLSWKLFFLCGAFQEGWAFSRLVFAGLFSVEYQKYPWCSLSCWAKWDTPSLLPCEHTFYSSAFCLLRTGLTLLQEPASVSSVDKNESAESLSSQRHFLVPYTHRGGGQHRNSFSVWVSINLPLHSHASLHSRKKKAFHRRIWMNIVLRAQFML